MEFISQEELTELPLWAAVALSARCARHVQPFILQGWPEMPKNFIADIERAISITEKFASQAAGVPNYSPAADADHAVDVATGAERFAKEQAITFYIDAAAAAAYAADEAGDLMRRVSWAKRENIYGLVDRAVRGATKLIQVQPSIRQDYEQLLQTAKSERWDDSKPVPPAFFDK